MARHDRGGGLAERAGLHVMREIRDHGAIHFEVDLDGRAAQFGMRGGAGVGGGQPSQPGDVAGQFDDPLVVNVVQHKIVVSAWPSDRPWRPLPAALYMVGNGGNTARLYIGGWNRTD